MSLFGHRTVEGFIRVLRWRLKCVYRYFDRTLLSNSHNSSFYFRTLNMDEEWEYEEQLVVVELSGIINNEHLSKCCSTCKILDIDSERPMMQVGQYVFAGEYEDTLGTCVLFEEAPQKGKAGDSPDLKYMCHTMKKLTMQRVFLTDKKDSELRTECGDSGEQTDTTCMFNEEQNETQPEETDKDMDNTALEGSSAS